jgi:hypothetical protein
MDLEVLRNRYESQSNDELLFVYVCGDLTDEAKFIMKQVLEKRDITESDYEYARKTVKRQFEYIQERKDSFANGIIRKIIFWAILLCALALYTSL